MLRYRMMLLAAATAAAWTNCAPAQPATSDLAAALFGSRESAKSVHLSPSGNLVSYIAPSSGGGAVGFIANVQTGDSKPFIKAGNSGEHLRWCAFVTDQRLICKYTGIADSAGILLPWSRLVAINSDGSDLKELGQGRPTTPAIASTTGTSSTGFRAVADRC